MNLVTVLPWILSLTTIYTVLAAGNKSNTGWAVGFVSQFVWFVWIILSNSWGLLPMNIILTAVYFRNYQKWKQP